MASKHSNANGHDKLEDAIATLIQNQASFVGQMAESTRRHQEFEAETKVRFARIESQMAEIIRVLSDHGRSLERLADTIRDKIGFKPQ